MLADSITSVDWLVVVVYLSAVTAIGMWASRRVTSAASFFISDRGFGHLFMTFSQFGAGTQTDQAVAVASKTYTNGLSGIWYQWLWLPVTPFYWIIGAMIRRLRSVTVADYFEKRYDRTVALLYAVMGLWQLIASLGLMLKGSAVMIDAVSGGQIDESMAIAGMSVLFVAYGVAGGLSAAILTDLLEGVFTILLSVLILPFALDRAGGMSGIRQTVENPEEVFSIIAPGGINAFYITILALNALIGFITSPTAIIAGAGKTELQSRFGLVAGSLMKRLCTVAWTLTGLCALAIYAGREIDPDRAYGMLANDLLPKIAPGLLGLFIASMYAATMNSCEASMVCAAGLFTRNIYRPFFQPNRQDRHYILVGRVASFSVVALSLLWAYRLESVIKGVELFWEISAVMGVVAWVGLFWRRATVAGAWAGTLATTAVWAFMQDIELGYFQWSFNARFADQLPELMLFEGGLYKPWHMICYLLAGLVALVAVSLLPTRRVDRQKLDRLFDCLRTPVAADEPETEPCTLPVGMVPAPRRVLFSHPDFEIPVPSRVSVAGFLITWLLVGLIVLGTVWIFRLGS